MELVEFAIGGRRFRLQCGPGEAGRVQQLARMVDQCAGALIQGQGGLGEEKLLLLANLMLTDHLEEAREEVRRLREEIERQTGVVRERAAWAVATAARRLDALAAHIERAASSTE
ncbi:MAG: cell division protein ZapA [Geminicoccaceae bacterium]